ncbi:MAG TPA: sulfatase [Thermoanaerobaculia bacterium]|nr:sulfatase [Thermoanaerobaculia bacterium]
MSFSFTSRISRLAGGLLLAAACAQQKPPPPRNVVFLLVDTLRADHLPLYGYGRNTSPALTALAGESVLFSSARAQSSCTFPSVNSILTSRYPAVFLGQPGGAMGLPAGIPGLAEILRHRGFRTVAISASPVVRRSPSRFNPGGGYDRGFERFDEECLWKPADCVVERARGELRRGGRPLLLYLHFMDPHGPYLPPPYHRRRFAFGHPAKRFVQQGDPNPIANWLYRGGPDPGLTAEDLRYLVDLYDDKIAFFDTQLDLLLRAIRRAGLLDETILVFAADHGEEFMEHGQIKHCRTVFDSSVRVPLLLRIPGGGRGRELATPAQNVDILPTLLDYLGVPAAGFAFAGRSLRPAIEGTALASSYQWSAQGTERGVADGRFKLVFDLATRHFALYDLAADPGERRDVLRDHRGDAQRLRRAMANWIASSEGSAAGDSVRQAAEAESRLRSLGYLE